MKKEFNREIKSEFTYDFEIDKESLCAISVKASCKPGWRNKWWLKFKDLLEDILDLHLDDEDLRVEIDGVPFTKPRGKQGLFNSPAAYSGTKILGKTKTVVFIIRLSKNSHKITFIPDGTPYLDHIDIEPVNNPHKFIRYFNLQAEDENYYSWYTFVLVNQQLRTIYLTAQAGVFEGETDDADLKIVVNGNLQGKKDNSHPKSYFCGLTLRGREDIFSQELNLAISTHYIELFADKQPTLHSIKIDLAKQPGITFNDPSKIEDEFNPNYVLKDAAFLKSDAISEAEIENLLRQHGENYPNHIYHKTLEGKKVSYWIKKFTFETEINAKVILTKLQAEKGLIIGPESINPTPEQLNWALGAGSTDKGNVAKYGGFYTQLKETPRLFRSYFIELEEAPFIKNVDGNALALVNKATYAFYRYTPHVAGADLFYRVYSQFFGKDDLGGKI